MHTKHKARSGATHEVHVGVGIRHSSNFSRFTHKRNPVFTKWPPSFRHSERSSSAIGQHIQSHRRPDSSRVKQGSMLHRNVRQLATLLFLLGADDRDMCSKESNRAGVIGSSTGGNWDAIFQRVAAADCTLRARHRMQPAVRSTQEFISISLRTRQVLAQRSRVLCGCRKVKSNIESPLQVTDICQQFFFVLACLG